MSYPSDRNDMTDHFRFRTRMNLSLLDHMTTLGVCGDTECECIDVIGVYGDTEYECIDVIVVYGDSECECMVTIGLCGNIEC